jgi:hypothetical protein
MSATKVVIILLVIVAVVFVVVVVRGPSGSASEPKNNTDFAAEEHPTLDKMNNLLGPYAPKVSAKLLVPSTQVFNLALLPPTNSISVLADPKQKFRQLAFSANPSKHCAFVKYSPSDKSGLNNKDQDSETSGSKDHPDQFAFLLLSGGGLLTINRAPGQGSGTCIITLHVAK